MLVLSRRTNEKIVIGDQITITVLGTRGDQVRIGIDAPAEVTVLREELVASVAAANATAAANGVDLSRLPRGGE